MKRFYVWWAALVFTAAGARAQFIDVPVSSGAALEASGHRSKPVPGQSLTPKPSAEGNEALDKLLERCQAEGGVKEVRDAESQAVSYALADAEKVKVTVVANRQLLTSALRDAAFARWNTAFRVPARRQRSTGLFGFAETLSSIFSIGDTPIRRIDEGQQRLGFVLLRAIGEATGDDRALAFATFLAGQAEVRRGDYTEALRDYEQAGQLFVTAKDPAWEAGCINRLGWVYAEQGEYLRAQENLLRAKDRAEKALGRDHPLVADCQENLGEIYARQKDYAKAEEYLRQAISIRSKAPGEHRPNVATDRVALGDAYARQGNTDEARAQFERALAQWHELLDENKIGVTDHINNIKVDYHPPDPGHMDKALEDLQALATLHKIYGDDISPIAAVLDKIGDVYFGEKQYDDALDQYRRSLDARRKIGGDDHPGVALGLYNLGTVHSRQEKDAEAREEMWKAVLASRQAPGQAPATLDGLEARDLRPLPLTTAVLHDYGRLLERDLGPTPTASQLQACARPYRLAAGVLERMRQDVLQTEASKISLGAERFDLFSRHIEICRRLFAVERKPEDLEAAFAAAEQGIARVFLEQMAKSRAESIGGVGDDLRQQETNIINRLRELDDQIAREEGRPLGQRDARRLTQDYEERRQVESERLRLVTRMEREYPRYAALKYPRPCSPADARSCLAADEVALLYMLGSETAHLIVVTKQADPETAGIAVHELGPADAIAELAVALTQRKTLEDADGARELGAQAYRLLLAPAADVIRGKALVIVPGGALGQIPFELLVEPTKAEAEGRFLVEGHRIRYAPSMTVLHLVQLWEASRPKAERTFWALGDPIYQGSDPRLAAAAAPTEDTRYAVAKYHGGIPGAAFPRLLCSGVEVERLAKLMEAAPGDVLVGPMATEADVKALSASGALARYRYVHFATHGILGRADGTPPSLVLALVGDQRGEDGFLRLDEVTGLKLNADLVVLSACQTGQGKLDNAEGVSGLARAFLYARSRAVLCSLWRVDDEATAELMADIYAGLKAGRSAPEALRSAQLTRIADGQPPRSWAPFILIGQ